MIRKTNKKSTIPIEFEDEPPPLINSISDSDDDLPPLLSDSEDDSDVDKINTLMKFMGRSMG